MTPLAHLRRARALLTHSWAVTDGPALRADGQVTSACAADAVKWSGWGALFASDDGFLAEAAIQALGILCKYFDGNVLDFFARASHAEVLALYGRVIASEEDMTEGRIASW